MRAHQRLQVRRPPPPPHPFPLYPAHSLYSVPIPQINAQITQDDKIDAVKHITKNGFYLPLAWADENAMLSPGLAKQWQDQVGLALRATNVLHLLGVIGGSLLCALAIVLGLVEFERNRQASHRRHLTAEGAEQILFHKTGSAEGVSLNRVADESSPLLSHPSLV